MSRNTFHAFVRMCYLFLGLNWVCLCMYLIDEWFKNEGCWEIQALPSHGLF